MTAAQRETIKSRLEVVISLSRLLDKVEASPQAVGADQYRSLVRQLSVALSQEIPHDALQAVLDLHPAASDLYENLHYDVSGLSRSPLDRSVNSEMMAAQAIAKASGKS